MFESLVMSFGLTKVPALFQTFINNTLVVFLDRYVTADPDDILIDSDTLDERWTHLRSILKALSVARMHLKPEKCDFNKEGVRYLELKIRRVVVKIDPDKVVVIQDWTMPLSFFNLGLFIGFVNFYRHFIRNLSGIVRPLTTLTGKDFKFKWCEKFQRAFEMLREAFITAPVWAHFDWAKDVVMKTDT